MKIYTVHIYKMRENGEMGNKKALMLGDIPATFTSSELAHMVGVIVTTALNTHMYSDWHFTVFESYVIGGETHE